MYFIKGCKLSNDVYTSTDLVMGNIDPDWIDICFIEIITTTLWTLKLRRDCDECLTVFDGKEQLTYIYVTNYDVFRAESDKSFHGVIFYSKLITIPSFLPPLSSILTNVPLAIGDRHGSPPLKTIRSL